MFLIDWVYLSEQFSFVFRINPGVKYRWFPDENFCENKIYSLSSLIINSVWLYQAKYVFARP